MSFDMLSTELIQKIYGLVDLADVVHLAQTSRTNYKAFKGQHFTIIKVALKNSFSPLPELAKLVQSKENSKEFPKYTGTEVRRKLLVTRITKMGPDPELTLEMMKKMVPYGRVAAQWTEVFPQMRWRISFRNRRFLKEHEKERLRRAIYNYWSYGNLFHEKSFIELGTRTTDPTDPRRCFIRTLSTMDLIQLTEFNLHVLHLIKQELYPSRDTIKKRDPQCSETALDNLAWMGDHLEYVRLVTNLMKYSPRDLLHLVNNTSTKKERAEYLFRMGDWFYEEQASLIYALDRCVRERDAIAPGFELMYFPDVEPFPADRRERTAEMEDVKFGIVDLEVEEARDGHAIWSDGIADGMPVLKKKE